MVECPYFNTNFMELTDDMELDTSKRDSFTIYMCVGGSVTIANNFGSIDLIKGETALISANSTNIHLKSKAAKLLEVTYLEQNLA